jgi:hypothetical protein
MDGRYLNQLQSTCGAWAATSGHFPRPIKFFFTILVVLCSLVLASAQTEFWIGLGPSGGGSGTMASPYTVTGGSDFDTIVNDRPAGTRIHLLPGTFVTKAGLVLRHGSSLIGSGIDVTVVQLQDNSAIAPANNAIIQSWDHASANAVTDMTVDCNLGGQASKATAAVTLFGGQTRIARIKTINWGSTSGDECFLLMIGARGADFSTNCVIEDCIVTQPDTRVIHTGGTTAIFIAGSGTNHLAPGGGWVWNGIIRNCSVYGVHPGALNQPPFFHGYGIADTVGGRIEHNFAFDLHCEQANYNAFAVYDENMAHEGYVIADNVFMDVESGIFFNPGIDGYLRNGYVIRDNMISLGSEPNSAQAIHILGTSASHLQSAIIQDNVVREGNGFSGNGSAIFVGNTDGIIVCGNRADLPQATADVTIGSGVTGITYNDNTTSAGANLRGVPKDSPPQVASFTVTASGWYRLCMCASLVSGNVAISENNYAWVDLQFDYSLNSDGLLPDNLGNITLRRYAVYPNIGDYPDITTIRIGRNSDGRTGYLDVYVHCPANQTLSFKVSETGDLAATLSNPIGVAQPGPVVSKQLVTALAYTGLGVNQPFTTTVTGINANSATATPILTVPAGRQYYVTSVTVETTAISGSGVSAYFSLGGNSSGFNNIVANTQLAANPGENTYDSYAPNQNAATLTGGTVLNFKINAPFSGTSQTLAVHVTGFYRFISQTVAEPIRQISATF